MPSLPSAIISSLPLQPRLLATSLPGNSPPWPSALNAATIPLRLSLSRISFTIVVICTELCSFVQIIASAQGEIRRRCSQNKFSTPCQGLAHAYWSHRHQHLMAFILVSPSDDHCSSPKPVRLFNCCNSANICCYQALPATSIYSFGDARCCRRRGHKGIWSSKLRIVKSGSIRLGLLQNPSCRSTINSGEQIQIRLRIQIWNSAIVSN